MKASTILVMDHDGAEMPRVSAAARPFGSRVMWADTVQEGLRLMAEARPELVIAADGLPGLEDPRALLEEMSRLRLASQLIVISSDPGFDRAMDLVADGVFAIVRRPVDQARLRAVVRKALDGLELMATLVCRSSQDSERELEIYKRLARSQELATLAEAVEEAGGFLAPGATARLELAEDLASALPPDGDAGKGADGRDVPADGGEGMFSFDTDSPAPPTGPTVSRELSFRGSVLGRLILTYPEAGAPAPPEGLDELVWAASLHLYQARQYQEAMRLASRDPLTSLLNRRAFMENLDREFAKACRHNTPLSLIMIDIDHFKSVNDTFGHLTGDKILRWVAQTLAATARTGDIIGRIGGEEFAVILPWTDQEQAGNLAGRIRESLATSRLPTKSALLRPTVSQGISTVDHFLINSAEDLIYWSDQAMYLAKREGRDTFRLASDLRPDSKLEEHRYVFQ
jgi:diguanylate cyclase (GGDEF)-like protein